jgi:DNA-binding CsgD family transcriptional regulator
MVSTLAPFSPRRRFKGAQDMSLDCLTRREREFIEIGISIKDLSSKMVSQKMGITAATAEVHKHHIFRKLKVNNSVALVLLYLELKAKRKP